jgi:GNAT superfamily N-acetyltransferase
MTQEPQKLKIQATHFLEDPITESDGVLNIGIYMLLDEEEIGFTESRFYKTFWNLSMLKIRPNNRGKGYAKKLLEETCQRLWSKHLVPIYADALPQETTITQERLEKLYSNRGFIKIKGTIKPRMRLTPPSVIDT